MPNNDNQFELKLNGVNMLVSRLDLPLTTAFRVEFSSARPAIVVARATRPSGDRFWTSVPEGRQKEAEGVGELIEEFLKQK